MRVLIAFRAFRFTQQFVLLRRPIIQTNVKSTSPAYPLLHIEAVNNALTESETGQIDPVLYILTDQGPSVCCHMECGGGLRLLCPVSGDGM